MARTHCKSISFFILNEVKDLNSLIISRLKQQCIGKAALARRTYKPIRWVNLASSGIQILDEKVDDGLARFGCILGARDHAYHPAMPAVRELVVRLPCAWLL